MLKGADFMDEQKNKNGFMIRIIIIGTLLWGFYIIQEEFAKYPQEQFPRKAT